MFSKACYSISVVFVVGTIVRLVLHAFTPLSVDVSCVYMGFLQLSSYRATLCYLYGDNHVNI